MGNAFLKKNKINNKGQGILESAIVLILMFLFLGGVFNIWIWANNQIVNRQKAYNATRVAAGTSSDSYRMQWPVYTPQELSEDKVVLDAPHTVVTEHPRPAGSGNDEDGG